MTRWATCPCRPTTIWNPAIFPVSTYADRKCSSIRANRSGVEAGSRGVRGQIHRRRLGNRVPHRARVSLVGGRRRCGRDPPGPGGSRHRRSQCSCRSDRDRGTLVRPDLEHEPAAVPQATRERPTTITSMSSRPSSPANNASDGSQSVTAASTSAKPTSMYGGFDTITSKVDIGRQRVEPGAAGRRGRCGPPGRGRRGSPGRRRGRSELASVIQTVVPSSGSSNAIDSPIAPDPVPRSATVRGRAERLVPSRSPLRRRVRSRAGGSAPAGRSPARCGGSSTGRGRTAAVHRSPTGRASHRGGRPSGRSGSSPSIDAKSSAFVGRRRRPRTTIARVPDRRPSTVVSAHSSRQFTGRSSVVEPSAPSASRPRPLLGGQCVDHDLQIAGEDAPPSGTR